MGDGHFNKNNTCVIGTHKDDFDELLGSFELKSIGFNRELKEKILIEFLLEMIQKSGSLLSMVSASKQEEELKILEMSL